MTDLITAVMPTPGTPQRRALTRLAVASFHEQTHPYRRLLILNHGDSLGIREDRVTEVMVQRPPTLGELRNLAFDHVREGHMITWDDDDWHGRNRMAYQLRTARQADKQACVLRSYVTLDLQTGQAFVRSCRRFRCRGCCGTILFPADTRLRYPAMHTKEDSDLALQFAAADQLYAAPNLPEIYIRTCHGENTSGSEHILNVKARDKRPLTPIESACLQPIRERFRQAGLLV